MPERTAVGDGSGVIRVWLVDDSANYRDLLATLLADEEDIECPRAFPTAEAVLGALACHAPPDVILLDVRMPGIGGLNAVRPIKTLSPSTRVLMLTTFYDSQAREEALRDGASDLLLKSYRVEDIADRIRRAPERAGSIAEPAGEPGAVAETTACDLKADPASIWPNRRAPALTHGSSGDHEIAPRPGDGPRNVSWRTALNRLMRGVGFLRSLFEHPGASPEPEVK